MGRDEEEESIAQIIASAVGPSGSNKDYLFQLANTMRTLGVADPHLFNIESRVRKILKVWCISFISHSLLKFYFTTC